MSESKINESELVTVGKDLIVNALKCIDAAANRGAYQGGELSTVGSVRDSLYVLVSADVEAAVEQLEADKSEGE